MPLNENEQFFKLTTNAHHVLITFPPQDNGEAIGAALALKKFLEKQNKQTDIISDNFIIPKNLKFLPHIDEIKSTLNHLQKFIVKLDVSQTPVDTISYDIKDHCLSIYLTPRQGVITKNALRTAQSTYKYDLIITLNTPDKESLGDIFLKNTDLFFRIPIINIDNRPNNESYGQINLINFSASGSNEIIYQLIQQNNPGEMDTETATALLTSLIIATQSFKTTNVNPHTLNYASELMALGGDRAQIVRQLYQTRSLPMLKIWGSALSKIKHHYDLKLVSITLTRNDFHQTGADETDIVGLGEELITTAPEAELILIIYESPTDPKLTKAIFISEKGHDAKTLLAPFSPHGNKLRATIETLESTPEKFKQTILEYLKNNLTR